MRFEETFLDDLRAAVRVSEVAGRKFKIRREGREFVAVEDPSIHINDTKGKWFDHGSAQEGGDVFSFLQAHEGLDFQKAVELVASIAGIAIPGTQSTGHQKTRQDRPADKGAGAKAAPAVRGKREIVAV